MKNIGNIILLLALSSILKAQASKVETPNLVENPSFELNKGCNGRTEDIEVETWSFVAGSGQFIGIGCPLDAPTKVYIQGMMMPPSYKGMAYAGMGLGLESEYLQGALTQPLEAGKTYKIGLWVRLHARACHTPIPGLGLAFKLKSQAPQEEFALWAEPKALLLRPAQGLIKETHDWQYIEAEYQAEGGETYFVLGTYTEELQTHFRQRPEKQCTYLFLDEMSLKLALPAEAKTE